MDIKQGFSKQITKINMKTSTFLEENKIRTYIGTLENDIKELYKNAGETGYEMWKEQSFDVAQLTTFYEQIQDKYNTISEQEKLIQELIDKSKQVLGDNGTNPDGQEQVFCANCGEGYPVTSNFCKKCGTKLHQ